jgi:type II secretory pathway pseudopilin PulG
LVELLVVITIIGILVALVTVAAIGALKAMREAEIKTNVNQLDTAMKEYFNRTTAFPPNCQTDGTNGPLNDNAILADLKKHMKQAFPRHQEPDDLIRVLAGFSPASNSSNFPEVLEGGMSAGEAVVFWLGGFSSDPKYPISGEGGPSYAIQSLGRTENRTLDPVESRSWVYPFDIPQLAPREQDGYFAQVPDNRFIEYRVNINGVVKNRRINFWQYTPRRSQQPYLYFDTSRHPAVMRQGTNLVAEFDPPAATDASPFALHVHAFKKASDSAGTGVPVEFVNPDKFQIIHCGDDDEWDEAAFERMSAHGVSPPDDPSSYLLFPTGPFIGEVADTIVNFTAERKIEDAQP